MRSYVGSLTQPTSAGSQVITGLGFQPKLIIFFPTNQTADGDAADLYIGSGCTDGTNSRSHSGNSRNNVNPAVAKSTSSTTACIVIIESAGGTSTVASANLTSFDSDGFTLNWTTADATARIINYIALGGSDLENAKVGAFTSSGSVGNQAITGVGFQPTAIMILRNVATPPGAFVTYQLSVGDSTPTGANVGIKSQDGGGQKENVKVSGSGSSSLMYWMIPNTSKTSFLQASLVSLDADGFTLNYTQALASTVVYIAIKTTNAAHCKVGAVNRPTVTGNQSFTGLGFKPAAVFLMAAPKINDTNILDHSRMGIGAIGELSSQKFAYAVGDRASTTPTNASKSLDRTKVIKEITENGATPTTTNAAEVVSIDSDGFTLNWTTVDGFANVPTVYLALGPSEVSRAAYYYGLINGGR